MKTWRPLLTVLAVAAMLCSLKAADPLPEPPAPAEPGTLIVVDNAGKEQKLKSWKFAAGVRTLAWFAPPAIDKDAKDDVKPKGEKAKPPAGPEALVFREDNSTDFQDGILTLIPVDRLRVIDYDNEKRTVAIRVAAGEKPADDALLTGTTKYLGVNRLTIEAEVDRGDMGIAEVKFLSGGTEKPIRAVRFAAPKPPAAAPESRPAFVVVEGKNNVQKVADLQPLYQFADGGERLLTQLMFKKTLKIDVAKVQKLTAVEGRVPEGKEMDVTLKDGNSDTLTLLKTITLDGKQATLAGLVGRVPAGYKLFPLHTFTEIQFDEYKESKPEKKDDKPEKKDDKPEKKDDKPEKKDDKPEKKDDKGK
jgi:hypothetical protein